MAPRAAQPKATASTEIHRVLLNLKDGAEWTLWPPTEKHLGTALAYTMLLLVLTEWSVVLPEAASWWRRGWYMGHMAPRVSAIALASA